MTDGTSVYFKSIEDSTDFVATNSEIGPFGDLSETESKVYIFAGYPSRLCAIEAGPSDGSVQGIYQIHNAGSYVFYLKITFSIRYAVRRPGTNLFIVRTQSSNFFIADMDTHTFSTFYGRANVDYSSLFPIPGVAGKYYWKTTLI